MARQQTKQLPYFSRWKDLFGTIKWKSNMGDTLVGVVSEYSPKATNVHKPKYITNTPLKTVASHYERSNVARLYRHKFESPLFNWLPNFRDFQTGQLDFAAKDLNRQVAFGFDDFVRFQIYQMSPAIFVCGAAGASPSSGPYITGIPVGLPGEGTLSDPKDANFNKSICAMVGTTNSYLDFRNICNVRSCARNVIGMVPWDGPPGAPSDNSIMSGKFILMGEPQIYEALTFDEHVLNTRDLPRDLLNKEFAGIISGNILFRAERYALRIAADGTYPAPEIEQTYAANGTITSGTSTITNPGGAQRTEVVPNPDWVNAPFGVAWFLGYQPYEAIDVGPPPSEFASAKIDTTRISKLTWNGEVRLTDDVLVNYGGSSGIDTASLDTNKYGEFLQLICDTVLGIIPKTSRFALPIIYSRINYPAANSSV